MICVEHLSKKFGEKVVLRDLSLQVDEGKIAFLVGKSGVGKSVLLKIIVGLLRSDAGRIFLDEEDVTHFSEQEFQKVRKKCALVFQNAALLDSLTVFENVAFGLRCFSEKFSEAQIEQRVFESLDAVNLPRNLSARLPATLSFGILKRVSIARALAIKPKYLLFDEPTTALDPIATRLVNKVTLDLARRFNVTCLIVSHDLKSALEIGDKLFFIEEGRIVEQGTPEEVAQSEVDLVKKFLEGISV